MTMVATETAPARVDMAAVLRSRALDMARWAGAISAVPFEAELIALHRPEGFGPVLVEVARAACARTGDELARQFPALLTDADDSAVWADAVDWLRDRADSLGASAVEFGRLVVELGEVAADVAS